jgi:hypothetical protein
VGGLSGRSVRSSHNGISLKYEFYYVSRFPTSEFVTSTNANNEGKGYDNSGEGRPESIWFKYFPSFTDLKASVNI